MHTYQEASDYLGKKNYRPLTGRSTSLVRLDSGCIAVKYHDTNVVTYFDTGAVMLNSDGWRTNTTKARLNDNLPRHWNVYQKNFQWYLRHWGDEPVDYEFHDGITIGYDALTDEYSFAK